ncbi:GDP-L-fucose synthase, putative (FS) [Plasmodium ovale curtisi]|uniref:GDP-L-fucose synthase, putative (FS) n=1 Tax=Plasmodium ovale curtisi TaxID=864141 RepID=A0A1A8W892_PLAOA|nr:GDP-L-fucose synthase, putative (FS) [Plasmodium ovale curtisi]
MARICLVTGGTGMLGSSLREVIKMKNTHFIESENHIIVNSSEENVIKKYVFLSSKVCDLTNFDDAQKFFQKNAFTDIIHFAAHVGGLYANIKNNLLFLINNLEINLNVIKLCHKFAINRGIFTLSTCIFPENCALPLIEENMHNGRCHLSNEGYSMSKRFLEILVRFYREKYNYEWICIIPTNIYGKYDNFNLRMNNTNVKLMGDGTAVRQFIYNRDVNTILYYMLNTYYQKNLTIIKDNIFNIIFSSNVPSNELTIKELADKIKYYLGFTDEILTSSNDKLMKILDNSFSFSAII